MRINDKEEKPSHVIMKLTRIPCHVLSRIRKNKQHVIIHESTYIHTHIHIHTHEITVKDNSVYESTRLEFYAVIKTA